MKLIKNIICIIGSIFTIGALFSINNTYIRADEKEIAIVADMYEFGDSSEYEIDASKPFTTSDNEKTLGKLSVHGQITRSYTKDGISALEIADNEIISILYNYDSYYSSASEEEWHIIKDGKTKVNGIELGNDIDSGALILQTSLDGMNWVTLSSSVNINDNISFDKDNLINNIQLYNGCYYKITVAYSLKKKDYAKNFLMLDTSDYSEKKYSEVYQFYASYKDTNKEATGNKQYFPVGAQSKYTVKTKTNNYAGSENIDSDDPHYGWDLGKFCLSGYTDVGDSEDVFLKTVGNRIKLSFKLDQDINNLPKKKGNKKPVYIAKDKNGSDEKFSIDQHNMKHGELIIKYTDPEGNYTFTKYSDYLKALVYPGADTTIQLFDEGDYEIHLNYAITDEDGIDETFYYRTEFCFKIRNGNCMVYLFDSKNNSELSNYSTTSNGFRIDSAKSEYPRLMVKKQILNDNKNGLIEDTRFNGIVSDGQIFSDEGLYTITATNRYIKDLKTEKTIYVGSNDLLKAYTKNEGTYSISKINNMIDEGYTISPLGEMIKPIVTEPVTTVPLITTVPVTSIKVTEQIQNVSDTKKQEITEMQEIHDKSINNKPQKKLSITSLMITFVISASIVIIVFVKKRKSGDE